MTKENDFKKQDKFMAVIRQFNACGVSCDRAAKAFKIIGQAWFLKRGLRKKVNK